MMWQMGNYVRAALMTSVVPVGLYDGKHKLGDYPKCPYLEERQEEVEMTEEQIQAERLRCYYYFKNFGKRK